LFECALDKVRVVVLAATQDAKKGGIHHGKQPVVERRPGVGPSGLEVSCELFVVLRVPLDGVAARNESEFHLPRMVGQWLERHL
jgi:hypothetical protein